MSRLDDHVTAVQNQLALGRFIKALGWASLVFGGVLWLAVLLGRIFLIYPPKPMLWVYAGAALTAVAAVVYALMKRPGPREAAVAIDDKLGLKEKISTALYIRPSDDPFAQAAVKDAEETARGLVVNLRQHFPMSFPKPACGSIVFILAAVLSYAFINPMNLFGRQEKHDKAKAETRQVELARKTVEKALSDVRAIPVTQDNAEAVALAKAELQAMLDKPIADPNKANRTAVKALQDLNEAMKEQVKGSAKYAQAQNEMKMFKSMQSPKEGQGPVSDAHRAIAKGEFSAAVDELTKAIENFDKMDMEQKNKASQQMKEMASQLQQMAQNPAQQEKMQQQLQQLGMDKQQAQQAQQLMQQAAQGDQQAMQQLQQQAQQMMQQMNNGQGPNPQQQQQIQQMMQQMQAQANAQQQAQQMAQAAQQLAQAMQQAQQGQPQQQPGQPQQQQGAQQQQMAQAMQQMQGQLQQMQAQAQDMQQIAAAQAAAQNAANEAQNGANGNGGGGQQGANAGQWRDGEIKGNGDPGQFRGQAQFAGANQGGIGAGDRTYKAQAPFTVKQEIDPSQDDEKGRILASTYIKDNKPFKGTSTASLQQVAEAAQKDQTDEIEQERISRQAAQAVKGYFGSMSEDQKQP